MMDSGRWDRIEALFHTAVDLPTQEQRSFLEAECLDDRTLIPEVLSMLEEDIRGGSLLDRDVRQVADQVLGVAGPLALNRIGPYRILRMLGEGGMGVVYLAERPDLGNLVAIKILRDAWLSPARRERFVTEQRTLAQFNHPSIARLYDANALPDGTPWFAMEYVDGVSLTEYCSTHNCPVGERLKLFRAVCEAVQYAHEHAVIHRDLKPSNILVKRDGSVRLLDFGIAKQLDSIDRPPVDQTHTTVRLMTPAYAAPERIRGERAGIHTDVYSLGVVLYELLAGRLPFDVSRKTPAEAVSMITMEEPAKPSTMARQTGTRTTSRTTAWGDLDVLCLTAMHKDPKRRYASIEAFIRDVNHYLNDEPLEARPDSLPYTLGKFFRRNWQTIAVAGTMVAAVVVAIALTLGLSAKNPPLKPRVRTVAVLPFENTGNDSSVAFLRTALANEVSGTLGYARSLSIRPSEAANKYIAPNRDLQKAGRELRVDNIVTGHFLKAGDQLQITFEVMDVESNRRLWREVFDVPAQNMVAMQAQIAAKTRRGLAPLLGASEFVTDTPPRPKNEEAYKLYLRAQSLSFDPESARLGIELLKKSVALDPTYAPAWEDLGGRYAAEGWFGTGGQEALERWRAISDRVLALDPDNVIFRADALYVAGQFSGRGIKGGLTRGAAYRQLEDLVHRRPDSARLHFIVSWMLRDTGLLDESARECEAALLVDAQDAGARSCGVTFMYLGDYQRAMAYLQLDPSAEVSQAVSIDVRLHQGRENEILQERPAIIPPWAGYDMLFGFLEHRQEREVAALARKIQPAPDPEVNYFAAAHLAYVGETGLAIPLLKLAIQKGYCAYPAIDSDPLFTTVRERPEFAEIRSDAIACQNTFLTQRAQTQ
jgi:serine/threonine protein kinase/tetratricopeptide (TPR) repeat protein